MSQWEKVEEDGMEIWVNETLGNIYKLKEGGFMVMFPKVISIGKFYSLQEAQQVLESPTFKVELSKALDVFNDDVVSKKIGV